MLAQGGVFSFTFEESASPVAVRRARASYFDHVIVLFWFFLVEKNMGPKTNSGASKKVEQKKKEKIIEVSCLECFEKL